MDYKNAHPLSSLRAYSFVAMLGACSILLLGSWSLLPHNSYASSLSSSQEVESLRSTLLEAAQAFNVTVARLSSAVDQPTREDKSDLVKGLQEAREGFKEAWQQLRNRSILEVGGDSGRRAVDPRIRNPTATGSLCEYSPAEMLEILGRPHGNSRSTARYFVLGAWRNMDETLTNVSNVAGQNYCIVVAAKGTLPCYEEECFYPVHVRMATSDMGVVKQVIENAEYDFLKGHKNITTILDGGGNIGVASLLFSIRWPDARIITVEPSSETYRQLLKNVGNRPHVTPVHAGLWSKNTKLVFGPNTLGAWGVNVIEADATATAEQLAEGITSVTVPYLLDIFCLESFDFAKIDIEGSEEQVLSEAIHNDLSWVVKAKVISVEYHHNAPQGVKKSYQYMKSHPSFIASASGEYDVFTRKG